MHGVARWWQGLRGVLIAAAGSSCGQPLEQTARTALTEQVETAHIVFRHRPGDHVDAEWQERFHGWMTTQLDVTLPRPLAYFKYTDRAHLEAVTGRRTNGFATPDTYSLHSIFPVVREFFRSGIRGAAAGVIDARIQAVWGTTLADTEREWLAVVDGWPD